MTNDNVMRLFFAFAFFAVALRPAWAWSWTLPVGSLFVINISFDALAPWASIIVAFLVYMRQIKADRKQTETNTKLTEVGTKIDGMLTDRDAANVKKGEAKEKLVGDATAKQRAEGVKEGLEIARAAAPVAPAAAPVDGKPLPVTDAEATEAAQKSAKALGRIADAAEDKGGKKVL